MKTSNLKYTLEKNKLEQAICDIEKEIVDLQSLDIEELNNLYHDSNHFLKEINSTMIDEMVDIKNPDSTISLINEACSKTNFLIETSEKIRAINNELLIVLNNQNLNKERKQDKINLVNESITQLFKDGINVVNTRFDNSEYHTGFSNIYTKELVLSYSEGEDIETIKVPNLAWENLCPSIHHIIKTNIIAKKEQYIIEIHDPRDSDHVNIELNDDFELNIGDVIHFQTIFDKSPVYDSHADTSLQMSVGILIDYLYNDLSNSFKLSLLKIDDIEFPENKLWVDKETEASLGVWRFKDGTLENNKEISKLVKNTNIEYNKNEYDFSLTEDNSKNRFLYILKDSSDNVQLPDQIKSMTYNTLDEDIQLLGQDVDGYSQYLYDKNRLAFESNFYVNETNTNFNVGNRNYDFTTQNRRVFRIPNHNHLVVSNENFFNKIHPASSRDDLMILFERVDKDYVTMATSFESAKTLSTNITNVIYELKHRLHSLETQRDGLERRQVYRENHTELTKEKLVEWKKEKISKLIENKDEACNKISIIDVAMKNISKC